MKTAGAAGSRIRLWLALLIVGIFQAAPTFAAPDYPRLSGRVVDQAGVLRSSTELAIAGQLQAHEAETSNQLVVVTLQSLQGYTIEEFGVGLGRHWGIGQEDRDNGALLIVAPNERKVRIEVGYGLEGSLTDALARTIIETEILPSFRRGNLERGVRAGVDSILAAIAGTYEAPARSQGPPSFLPVFFFAIAIGGLFLLSVVWMVREAGDSIGGRTGTGNDWNNSSSGRNQGGGWSGGGFGGGGFSGGGGGFGGGGSSGGW